MFSLRIFSTDLPPKLKNDTPEGEILLRGPSLTSGYFKRPDLSDDDTVFTKDGWFRTGNIGRWNKDGTLSIVDRLKNLVKLQGGECIAVERLESIYKSCNLISNLCVHASGDMTQPIAIVCPHEGNLRRALSSSSESSSTDDGLDPQSVSFSDICASARARETVLQDLNGFVTAAQKVQRAKVREAFKDEIEKCVKKQKGGK